MNQQLAPTQAELLKRLDEVLEFMQAAVDEVNEIVAALEAARAVEKGRQQ